MNAGVLLVILGEALIVTVVAAVGLVSIAIIPLSFLMTDGDFLGPFFPVFAVMWFGPIGAGALLVATRLARLTLRFARGDEVRALARIDEVGLALSAAGLVYLFIDSQDDAQTWALRLVLALAGAGSLVAMIGLWRLAANATPERARRELASVLGAWAALSVAVIAFYPTGAHPPYCTPGIDPCALEPWRQWWIESPQGKAILGALLLGAGVIVIAWRTWVEAGRTGPEGV